MAERAFKCPPDVGFYGTNNIAGYQHGAAIEVAIRPALQAGIKHFDFLVSRARVRA
jgi:hypothetical protein